MGMIDHWHPVYPSRKLKKGRAAEVTLCNRNIALFRTRSGEVGALDNMCPHRRMKLSLGTVVGERLQCKYHGWTFDCNGAGESPGTPKLNACAGNYETREEQGFIWMKPRGVEAVFPRFEVDDMLFMASMEHVAPAPLEVAVDNFCEIEHTGTVHEIFGYKLDRLNEVQVKFEATPDTVRVINTGPPKSMGWFLHWLLHIRKNHIFTDDWTTHFSPVYSVYDHYWSDPNTGQQAWVRWRLYMFFTPIDEKSIRVTTFSYVWSRYPYFLVRPFRRLMWKKLYREIELDAEILGQLASYDTSLEGMKLSRFDKALGLNRERIAAIYRGQ
jgi:phenylpropionate dioxygenase-like ring-hydroxylating dioxygenase large terminal subunit